MTLEQMPKTDLSPLELRMRDALARCTFLPGSFDKRFVRTIAGATALTEKQRALFHKLFYRYRRQIGLSAADVQRVLDRVNGIQPAPAQLALDLADSGTSTR